jgi:uncharacterized protein (DUF4415 family)
MTDEDIVHQIAENPDAAPILDSEWFRTAQILSPRGKAAVSLRLDRDVVAWFRMQGPRYQTRMNAVLRSYMLAHRKPTAREKAAKKAKRR